jgi:hypothetical protein
VAESTQPSGGFLDARKAKAVFVLGVGLYLLMSFWSQSPMYRILGMASKGEQLDQAKSRELERPKAPVEPQKPPEKAADVGDLNNRYDKLKKEFDEKKKEYDDKLIKEYQRDEWRFEYEEMPDIREDMEDLEKDYKWAKATLHNWAWFAFLGRFIGTVLMLIGLGFTAVNGSEWERAAAIVVIGVVLVGTGGTLGGVSPFAMSNLK